MHGLHAEDSHGGAALLLVESLIHELIARSLLTTRDALNVVDVARDARAAISAETDASWDRLVAVDVLSAIYESLSIDLDLARDTPSPE